MVATAHISYPTGDSEETKVLEDSIASEETTAVGNPVEDGPEAGETERAYDEHGAPVGREYGVSPEDFCASPYSDGATRYDRQELGRKGEQAAARYLEAKGYEILQRNWFCKFGEADIIARDIDGTLCFIEVKTRQSIEAGIPEEAITPEKQGRYERIALSYMMVDDNWSDNDRVRFDAIGICVTKPHSALLRHHKGCFNGCI